MFFFIYRYIYLPTYLPTYQPTNLPTYQPTSLPTYLPTNLPTYQPTNLPTYIHTYIHMCIIKQVQYIYIYIYIYIYTNIYIYTYIYIYIRSHFGSSLVVQAHLGLLGSQDTGSRERITPKRIFGWKMPGNWHRSGSSLDLKVEPSWKHESSMDKVGDKAPWCLE